MSIVETLLRTLSGLAALGTAIGLGLAVSDVSRTAWTVDFAAQFRVFCYLAALVLMVCASGLILLVRNRTGSLLAFFATLVAGPIFILGTVAQAGMSPGFPAGTSAATVLGAATLVMVLSLVIVERRSRTISGGRPTPTS